MKIKIELELDTERDAREIEELIEMINAVRERENEEYDD
jgi:hypothetical protein